MDPALVVNLLMIFAFEEKRINKKITFSALIMDLHIKIIHKQTNKHTKDLVAHLKKNV